MRRALFPGSFDPFTLGHYSLVRRALTMVDKVVIAVGINESKNFLLPFEERVNYIKRIFENEKRVKIVVYEDLTVDVARREKATFILRGVRNGVDFEYERMIAEVNRSIEGVETLLLYSEPDLAHISSSMVREIYRFGRPIDRFLPLPLDI
ncbi:MAG: pantetheine-phosphate adenylyltransferase [Bacteroidales bacterium]|nr:pantetheine-phosphate adenylyltransferase [Bacteroidales bacterium]